MVAVTAPSADEDERAARPKTGAHDQTRSNPSDTCGWMVTSGTRDYSAVIN